MEFHEDETRKEQLAASTGTSLTTRTSGREKKRQGQHSKNMLHKGVHAIHQVWRKGEPFEPTSVLGTFSNTCGVVVK